MSVLSLSNKYINSELEMELKDRQITFIRENLSHCDIIVNGVFRCVLYDEKTVDESLIPKVCEKYEKDGIKLIFVNIKSCPSNYFLTLQTCSFSYHLQSLPYNNTSELVNLLIGIAHVDNYSEDIKIKTISTSERILQSSNTIPGIGNSYNTKLLNTYKSLRNISNLSESDLCPIIKNNKSNILYKYYHDPININNNNN